MPLRPALLRVALFFGIALALSWYFRVHVPAWFKALELPLGLTQLKYLLEGIAPLLGALAVLGTRRRIL